MTINSMINTIPNLQYSSYGYATGNERSYDNNIDQLDTISSILSQYDPNNLSSQDASAIANAFQESGIEPSKELAETMASFGFDAQEVGTLAGVIGANGRPNTPPPPPPSQKDKDDVTDALKELLSDDEESSENSNTFEQLLDYTSHIVNLNDRSRDKVNELFEQYSPNNTQLSKEDASSVIKNSLSQILSDSNNYNSVSFYA